MLQQLGEASIGGRERRIGWRGGSLWLEPISSYQYEKHWEDEGNSDARWGEGVEGSARSDYVQKKGI